MLIGISGTLGSGKTEVARYLTLKGFQYIDFDRNVITTDGLIDEEVEAKDGDEDEINKFTTRLSINDQNNELIPDLKFKDIEAMIDYVTKNWLENFVFTDINSKDDLIKLSKRPFFLHISIDAPLKIRYKRYNEDNNNIKIMEFIEVSDFQNFNNSLCEIISQSTIKIINKSSNIEGLYSQLDQLKLLDPTRLRPNWDSYFMRLADLAALRSNCMKRRVGCVIVRDKRVIATGYNGTPRHMKNCNEGGCHRCNHGNGSGAALSTCLCLHAEENALLESGRDRIGINSTLYCNTHPCLTCSIKIVQTGLKEVVYTQSYSMDELSSKVLKEGGVILRQYIPPKDGIIII
ncbi:hypothetical protein WICMUC_001623 [Wickerhamomyces mucosus]|uniref:Deoxycytidylate deaminase n=1 Tax=Wickerhamomyces mucosus TaxID=1378264 RepID=A0A9P8PVT7_9ASCO|nr:hypothetical protein WICMUC_001623 [Wickerhamomyces mucosus]